MIIHFFDTHLNIPKPKGRRTISHNTPQFDFILSHKADIEKEIAALHYLIKEEPAPALIVDAMAGCGFSGKVFKRVWPDSYFILNDASIICWEILQQNFPNDLVYHDLAQNLEFKSGAFVFVDFNAFTLKKENDCREILKAIFKKQPDTVIVTDSASYGFKFKDKFLNSYNIKNTNEYYSKVRTYFYDNWGYWVNEVRIFGNAALLKLKSTKQELIITKSQDSFKIRVQLYRGLF